MIGRAVSESEADEEEDEEKVKVVNSTQKDCFDHFQLSTDVTSIALPLQAVSLLRST